MKHSPIDSRNFKKKKWKVSKPLGTPDVYNLTVKDLKNGYD